MAASQYVFGYGSLAAAVSGSFVAHLSGGARGWGVAMDNTHDIPGYKWYATPDGERPSVHVCFLDLQLNAGRGDAVNGVCLPVNDGGLAVLDARERNYTRVDVTARIDCGARVWTYVGSAAGRARFAEGVAAGRAVIARAYLDTVRAGFQALGAEAWAACAPSLKAGELPVRTLVRHEL